MAEGILSLRACNKHQQIVFPKGVRRETVLGRLWVHVWEHDPAKPRATVLREGGGLACSPLAVAAGPGAWGELNNPARD